MAATLITSKGLTSEKMCPHTHFTAFGKTYSNFLLQLSHNSIKKLSWLWNILATQYKLIISTTNMKMEGTDTISDVLMLYQLQIESKEENKFPGMWEETEAINLRRSDQD